MAARTSADLTLTSDDVDHAADMLGSVVGFEALPPDALRDIAGRFAANHAGPGAVLIREGDPPTGFFLLLDGRVEILQGAGADVTLLNVLGPGAAFGAMAFVDHLDTADATVKAAEAVRLLYIDPAAFRGVLAEYPDLRAALHEEAHATLRANFLAHTSAFRGISPEERRLIADAVETVQVDAGTILMRQGEPGSDCYLIATGKAEVIVDHHGTLEVVASLEPGALVGEGSLLTDSPRTATVRMATAGTLLRLSRESLLEAVGHDRQLTSELVGLLRMRWRPQRREGVEVHERRTPEGETIVILKDPRRGAYYRLAGDGVFIWERLDGEHTLRDIAIDYVGRFGRFDPDRIARAVKGLVDAGFALAPGLRREVRAAEESDGTIGRSSLRALAALSWKRAIDDVDAAFTRLDRVIGRFLFHPVGVAITAVLAVAGIVLTITSFPRDPGFLDEAGGPIVLLALLPANAFGAVLHEAAHGLVVKRFGRQVRKAGVGWFFITPIVFVDTSDMWLESRWRRALVSMAGPFMNLVVAGIAAIGAVTADTALVQALWWQGVIASFYLAALNLNPLLEFDGYYILSDVLDRPNLREEALEWLGTDLLTAVRHPSRFRGHGVDVIYGVLAALYMAAIAALIVLVYRGFIQDMFEAVLPDALASATAWVIVVGVAGLLVLALSAQLRGLTAPRH